MLRRLSDSEEDTNDSWLQAYMTGEYFERALRGAFLPESLKELFSIHTGVLVY